MGKVGLWPWRLRGGKIRKGGTNMLIVKIMQSSIVILEKTGCNGSPVFAIHGAKR